MLEKLFKIIFPSLESSFANYILPTIFIISIIILLWVFLLATSKFIKIKSEKWENAQPQKSIIRKLIVTHKSLIHKSLASFRYVLTLYILFMFASHILETVSVELKNSLARAGQQTVSMWGTFSFYTDKSAIFFDVVASKMLKIFFTILIAVWCIQILQKAFTLVIHKPAKYMHDYEDGRRLAKRKTLDSIISYLLKIVVSVIALFTILQNLNINIAALLATAGLASVAIGFGAQSLVKDFIAGFFILFEDQFAVGDVVDLGATAGVFSGTIEKMTLRMVRVRSNEGSLVTIPNGDIRSVKNYTTDWSRIDFKYGLELKSNLEKAAVIFREEIEQFCKDFSSEILGTPDIRPMEKIVDFENKSVATTFRVFIKTPDVSTKVKLEMKFNQRLLVRFKNEDIYVLK